VAPGFGGWQGGNFMEVNTGAQQRQGVFMVLNDVIATSWTAECIFRMDSLNPDFAEYKIQDIMQAWFIGGSNTRFEIRHFGDQNGIGLGNNVFNLTDSNASGGGEVSASSAENLAVAGEWNHLAVTYDGSTNTMSAYLNKALTPIAQITPGHNLSTPQLGNIILGAWANDAGSARDLAGSMDAFVLSTPALTPDQFLLPMPAASVNDWTLMN
jgi:hypothetical protein